MINAENFLRCTDPAQVEETDLFNYIEDLRRPGFVQHMAQCNYCRKLVNETIQITNLLETKFKRRQITVRNGCPDVQVLGDYMLGYFKDPAKKTIHKHLEKCPQCQTEYLFLRQQQKEDQAEFVVRENLLQKVVARLGEPRLTGFTVGSFRGPEAANITTRPIPDICAVLGVVQQFQAEDCEITLELQAQTIQDTLATKSRYLTLTGEITREIQSLDLAKTTIYLKQATKELTRSLCDQVGNFYLEFTIIEGNGKISLELEFNDKLIIIEAL